MRPSRFRSRSVPFASFVLAGLLPLAPAAPTRGNDYFVDSQAGSDRNSGTSPESPWQSIAKVQAARLKPGDTVRFRSGGAWTGLLSIPASGEPGRPITIASYGTGEKPIFRNPPGKKPNWERCVEVRGRWVVVDGLSCRDSFEAGIVLSKTAEHCVVRNCDVSAVGIGVQVNAPGCTVAKNEIHDLKMVTNTPGGDDDYGAVGVWVSAPDCEVSSNRMLRCSAPSRDYGSDGGAVELYGKVDNARIVGNFAKACNGFLEVGGKPGECRNVLVAYNASLHNNGSFLYLHTGGKFGAAIENLRIENNTVVDTGRPDGVLLGWRSLKEGQASFRNNVVHAAGRLADKADALKHEHNLLFRTGGRKDFGLPLHPTERCADPLFRDLGKDDLRLRPGSPAIDAGLKLEHKADIEGNPVPSGPAPDLGAYESRAVPDAGTRGP